MNNGFELLDAFCVAGKRPGEFLAVDAPVLNGARKVLFDKRYGFTLIETMYRGVSIENRDAPFDKPLCRRRG